MRRILPSCLLGLALLPLAAHADTLDNFTIIGDSHTYTFTLPQVFSFPDQLHLVALPSLSTTGTIDGVGNQPFNVTFFTSFGGSGESMAFNGITLSGGSLVSLIGQSGTPGQLIDTAEINAVGSFSLLNFANSSPKSGPDFFDVTIDQTTTTPEPSTLALLATGILGIFAKARRRSARA